MHNLQRVEAGLRGEWLAPSLDLGENNVKVAKGMDDGTNTGDGEGDHMQVDGWQDLDEYQREQSIEEGEVGPRQTGIAQEGDEVILNQILEEELPRPKNVKRARENGGATEERPKKAKNKEARKKEKKARHKEEQRRKEEERRKHSEKQ
jgi:hypothetical protein